MSKSNIGRIIGLSGIFLVGACGSSGGGGSSTTPSPSPGGGSSWTNTAMLSLVNGKCATSGCHDGSQKPNYKGISESSMRTDTKALSEVKAGRMPIGSSLSSSELQTFKAFYGN